MKIINYIGIALIMPFVLFILFVLVAKIAGWIHGIILDFSWDEDWPDLVFGLCVVLLLVGLVLIFI